MKWVNHMIIAAGITFVVNPPMVPAAILGSTAPDWLEWVINGHTYQIMSGYRGQVKHRTVTHTVLYWLVAMLVFGFIWDFYGIGFWFAFGGLSHCVTDALTAQGVPLTPWSDRRVHLFGGRLRTGQPAEFLVAGGVLVICLFVASHFQASNANGAGFVPFFYNWSKEYQEGVIDGSEWRENRFRLI